jgi:hypothetical protein
MEYHHPDVVKALAFNKRLNAAASAEFDSRPGPVRKKSPALPRRG